MLTKLTLGSKKGFQLLYPFSLYPKNIRVSSIGQCLQISRPIVRSNPVEMVHNPTIGQAFAITLLPIYNMLKHITSLFVCPRMVWHTNNDIRPSSLRIASNSTPSPIRVILPQPLLRTMLGVTIITPDRLLFNWSPTTQAGMSMFVYPCSLVFKFLLFIHNHYYTTSMLVTQGRIKHGQEIKDAGYVQDVKEGGEK